MCACVSVCECVCVSADKSPYCSTIDEWLIMKLCTYVGANNVSTFGGDQLTQLNFKKCLRCFTDTALQSSDAVTLSAAVARRSRADCSLMEGHTNLSTALVSTPALQCQFTITPTDKEQTDFC